MIAGFDIGDQRAGAGGQPRGVDHGAVTAFQFGHRFFQRSGGGRAVPPVVDAGLVLGIVAVLLVPVGQIGRDDGRGVVHGRVDHSMEVLRVASCVDGTGFVPNVVLLFAAHG